MSELLEYLTKDKDEQKKIRAVTKHNTVQIWVCADRVQELLNEHVAEVLRELAGEKVDTGEVIDNAQNSYLGGIKVGLAIARDIIHKKADDLSTEHTKGGVE